MSYLGNEGSVDLSDLRSDVSVGLMPRSGQAAQQPTTIKHLHEYNSFAGTDIVAQLILPEQDPVTLGELQTISYSIHRENHPVRTLGHVMPIGHVKGARTVAGSMIFTVFNNYAFYRFEQFQKAIQSGMYPVADMLPPFDVVITFANEYGVFSKMKIYGVTFVDEGGVMSIDDMITESTFSYMARGIQPLTGYVPRDAAEFYDAREDR